MRSYRRCLGTSGFSLSKAFEELELPPRMTTSQRQRHPLWLKIALRRLSIYSFQRFQPKPQPEL